MSVLEAAPESQADRDMRFMDATAEYARLELDRHLAARLERNPDSYLDVMTPEIINELTGQPPLEGEDDAKSIFIGNNIVENGLGEYNRVNSEVFELNPAYRAWKNNWHSEEWDHGPAMQLFAEITRYVSAKEIHDRTQGYLRHGLTLNFKTAAHGLAYPALQEPATRMSHIEVMRTLPKASELLAGRIGRRVMGLIIADEAGHEAFYTRMVGHILRSGDRELTSAQMLALADAILGFSMPGIEHDIPGGRELTKAYRNTDVFSFPKLGKDILLPAIGAENKYDWDLAMVTELSDDAKKVQEDILQSAEDLTQAEADGNDHHMGLVIVRARKKNGLMAVKQ